MSNIEVDSSDEEYYPSPTKHRNSCPTKKLAFSSKVVNEQNPFGVDSLSSPKKQGKYSSKTKAAAGTKTHNTGRWSKEEHQKFLEAIDLYGRDWKKVQDYVVTRTSTQARSHAQKVLPHPSWGDGVTQSHNSTATTLTKSSPISNKNEPTSEFKKTDSFGTDSDFNEFAIFKVEKVRKQVIGRDRVNSENNVFSFPVGNGNFDSYKDRGFKQKDRKYSMNIEFSSHKTDLMNSPIKESIKEQIIEDEEDEIREPFPEVPFTKHKTIEPKSLECFGESHLFTLNQKEDDLNLDSINKPSASDFPMEDIDDGLAPWNSLNIMEDSLHRSQADRMMDSEGIMPFNMDEDMQDSYYPITHNFD